MDVMMFRDTLASRTSHLKDGLNRLFCLVPYEVITEEIWDYVMPHWMEAVVNDVPEKDLPELRIILSKILDNDMSPLGFDAKKMYNFVGLRFKNAAAKVQEQALHWLQVRLVQTETNRFLTSVFFADVNKTRHKHSTIFFVFHIRGRRRKHEKLRTS